jgi:hypothetical protein
MRRSAGSRILSAAFVYAEPTPKGFGFSETAFRIFILMASRRLKSVLLRHYPELLRALRDAPNAFAPWARV